MCVCIVKEQQDNQKRRRKPVLKFRRLPFEICGGSSPLLWSISKLSVTIPSTRVDPCLYIKPAALCAFIHVPHYLILSRSAKMFSVGTCLQHLCAFCLWQDECMVQKQRCRCLRTSELISELCWSLFTCCRRSGRVGRDLMRTADTSGCFKRTRGLIQYSLNVVLWFYWLAW